MAQRSVTSWLTGSFRRINIWLVVVLFLLITLFQYAEYLNYPAFLAHLNANLGLTRYTLERILYLLPIIWAGVLFGRRGGAITASIAVACMLPRSVFISPNPEDAIVETLAVFLVGNLAAFAFESLRKERERRSQLEAAQRELQSQLHIIAVSEKRLAALNQTSTIISQSLNLTDVLDSAVNCVTDVMGIEVVRLYILDEADQELGLAAYRGLTEEFVRNVGRIRMGEGFNGRVAETGEPLIVEDACEDPLLTKMIVRDENIRSQVIVPLIAKGKVMGTLSAAMHSHRNFFPEEVNLLTAIGNQIGIAIDNARLYQQEREVAEQLRASEQRYRGLFENAHDAIWLYDLEDNIIAANSACVSLTGYVLSELQNLKASQLISEDNLEKAKGIEQRLLRGQALGSLDEVKLIRKDGSEAFIQLACSLALSNGRPVAFQNIARNVTEEKRMQENLQFYLQQITRAQEEERKRIAQELHDDSVQALVVHSRQIDTLSSRLPRLSKRELAKLLEDLHEQANSIMQGIQRLSHDLRPAALDRLGLVPAVEWLGSRIAEYSGMDIKVKFIGTEQRLRDEVELVLFRITQEALRNVWKHAEASIAEIMVEFEEDRVRITVKDNGKGFDLLRSVADLPRYGMLGLAGMQERTRLLNGTLTVWSELGKGTTITAELPVQSPAIGQDAELDVVSMFPRL